MQAKLVLQSGLEFEGKSFGYEKEVSGEMVFTTGMVGYPESLTDPSYRGQILVITYPLVGSYGVPDRKFWESNKIQVSGLVVSSIINTPSHYLSKMTLSDWLRKEKVPGLEIKDTRFIAKYLAEKGSTLGGVDFGKSTFNLKNMTDPNKRNLVSEVSTKKIYKLGKGKKRILVFDCGVKRNILNELVKRGVEVVVLPYDYDIKKIKYKYNGVLFSNGPGDPKMLTKTIATARDLLKQKKPILGICLGNQILALAGGGDTYKLKFGHRSQNQPCLLLGSKRCYLTTQNHGYAVNKVPKGFKEWFKNANDNTNEGIIHKSLPFMSVQFHPESTPGPLDTLWIFDEFLRKLVSSKL